MELDDLQLQRNKPRDLPVFALIESCEWEGATHCHSKDWR